MAQVLDEALLQVKDQIMKAAETIATNTFDPASRSVFSPENLDEKIKLLVPTSTPLRNRFPRVKGIGQAAGWKMMTSRLHANVADSGAATAISFADAGAPNETTQTYSDQAETFKLLGRKIEVGGLANAASKGRDGQPDMLESRERIKMTEVLLGEEELLIAGDADNRVLEFNGLFQQISTNSGTATFLTASGVQSYFETIYNAGGLASAIVCHSRQSRALADDLSSSGSIQRMIIDNQGSAIGGVRLAKVVNNIDGSLVDVLVSRYVHATALVLSEKSEAGEPWIEVEELIPMSRVDINSLNFSQISFVLEAQVLKLIAEPFQYELAGLATT